jgi:protein-tyrosine phosphatase
LLIAHLVLSEDPVPGLSAQRTGVATAVATRPAGNRGAEAGTADVCRRRPAAVQNVRVPSPTDPSPAARSEPSPLAVCFVCTGNICRSPMADVVLRTMARATPLPDGTDLADHLEVSSAGTGGWHAGEPMDPRARLALERRGYVDHGHRAQKFDVRSFQTTDLLVCMDRGHQQTLLSLGRGKAGDDRHDERLVLLRSFDPRARGAVDIPDPYYGGDAHFEACLDLVVAGCRGLTEALSDRVLGPS